MVFCITEDIMLFYMACVSQVFCCLCTNVKYICVCVYVCVYVCVCDICHLYVIYLFNYVCTMSVMTCVYHV